MGAWHQLNLSIFKKVLSVGSGKLASELNDVVQAINDKEKEIELFSDEEIKLNFQDLSKKLNGDPQSIEIEAFAYIREAAKRTLGQRHYDVQLFGGLVLLRNKIAEMKTGEGKTFVSTLPISLMALFKKGVHVVTVNEYLAKRDAEWMSPIYNFLGLEVGLIHSNQNPEEKNQAYKKDITYGTNNEFGFDYLRDNMAHNKDDLVQRKHNYAIVDEVDSVLVDDARTPLIISGPTPLGDRHEYDQLKPKISSLVNNQKTLMNKVLADAKAYINAMNKLILKRKKADDSKSVLQTSNEKLDKHVI